MGAGGGGSDALVPLEGKEASRTDTLRVGGRRRNVRAAAPRPGRHVDGGGLRGILSEWSYAPKLHLSSIVNFTWLCLRTVLGASFSLQRTLYNTVRAGWQSTVIACPYRVASRPLTSLAQVPPAAVISSLGSAWSAMDPAALDETITRGFPIESVGGLGTGNRSLRTRSKFLTRMNEEAVVRVLYPCS